MSMYNVVTWIINDSILFTGIMKAVFYVDSILQYTLLPLLTRCFQMDITFNRITMPSTQVSCYNGNCFCFYCKSQGYLIGQNRTKIQSNSIKQIGVQLGSAIKHLFCFVFVLWKLSYRTRVWKSNVQLYSIGRILLWVLLFDWVRQFNDWCSSSHLHFFLPYTKWLSAWWLCDGLKIRVNIQINLNAF